MAAEIADAMLGRLEEKEARGGLARKMQDLSWVESERWDSALYSTSRRRGQVVSGKLK